MPRAQREQQILDAAAEEFGRNGYGGASLSAVASGAGVSKPLVLNYFGSKDGLYVACVERAGANLIDRIEQAIARPGPAARLATDTLAAIFAGLAPRPNDWNVINDRTVPRGSDASNAARNVRAAITEQANRGVAIGADILTIADPDDLAILVGIWMNAVSAIVDWWLRNPDRTAAEMTERSRRIFAALSRTGTEFP